MGWTSLIEAALVVPAVVARTLSNGFARILWQSSLIGGFCGLGRVYLSYHLDISSVATIVLVEPPRVSLSQPS